MRRTMPLMGSVVAVAASAVLVAGASGSGQARAAVGAARAAGPVVSITSVVAPVSDPDAIAVRPDGTLSFANSRGHSTLGTPRAEAASVRGKAAADERKTYVYLGARRNPWYVYLWDGPPYGQVWGYPEPEGARACLSGNGAWPNAKGTTIVLRNSGESKVGYARRQSSGVWVVFAYNEFVGSVRRVTAARWNGYDGRRLAGHTRGPDGPAAWAAYLAFCGS